MLTIIWIFSLCSIHFTPETFTSWRNKMLLKENSKRTKNMMTFLWSPPEKSFYISLFRLVKLILVFRSCILNLIVSWLWNHYDWINFKQEHLTRKLQEAESLIYDHYMFSTAIKYQNCTLNFAYDIALLPAWNKFRTLNIL